MTDLLEPWIAAEGERQGSLERELERELPLEHELAGKSMRALAVRTDKDDVLFEVVGGGYAVVHLTWSGRRDRNPAFPSTQLFSSLKAWRDQRMTPDHEQYSR
ncbi:MAG TPA: hypothetical protein VGM90_00320 [Kofleriaceae bacterium]|jgi:hypothetical protein